MTCAEFQKVLPYIIETGGNEQEDAHLRTCPVCADLVADLKYIAEQAKLLVPMEEPSERVWTGIQKALEQEGLVRPASARRALLGTLPWLVGAAAMVLITLGIFVYSGREDSGTPKNLPAAQASTNADDERMLAEVSARRPDLKATYAENLKNVNAYITDAQHSVQQNPDDDEARQSLIQAYEQKALLYEMALSRSLQ